MLASLALFAGLGAAARAQDVTTFHYDNARTGAQTAETTLTPANVNYASFGKTLTFPVDGDVYAQPLYLAQYTMADGAPHNVLFVATAHDWVYAIDASGNNPAQGYLWRTSLLGTGETWVSASDVYTDDISPDIGVTGTPVIDRASGTLYVVAKSKGNGSFAQRLHALNLADGSEKLNGPTTIAATLPGSGDGGTTVSFDPFRNNQRAALLLAPTPGVGSGASVYIAWASHGDNTPYHGWIISYNAADISQQTSAWVDTPNGAQGGIWMSGGGLSADAAGNIFVGSGNGTFDAAAGGLDVGDSELRLTPGASGLALADFFTPFDQLSLSEADTDFGASDSVLLPDQPGAAPHLLVTMGKSGQVYLLNRDQLGGFNQSGNNDVQEFSTGHDSHSNPVFFNNTLYYAGNGGPAQAFTFNPATGRFLSDPQSQSGSQYGCPQCDGSGSNLSVSADGAQNGIVWSLDNNSFGVGPAILHAYDATNLANELYNSTQAASGRDTAAGAVKFTTPVVANGSVYIGGSNAVTVYGLIGGVAVPVSGTATPILSPAGGSFLSPVAVTVTDATPGAVIYYTTDGSAPTTASAVYSGPVTIAASGTLTAIAVAPGANASAPVKANFVVGFGALAGASFSGGFTAAGMSLNGSSSINGTRLRLTDGGIYEAGSGFYSTPVDVQRFINDFTFQLTNPNADGIAFVIQNVGPAALGPQGGGLGYGPDSPAGAPGLADSVAIKFDLYDNLGEGLNSTGLYVNGASPTIPATDLTPTNINLHSGDLFAVHSVYDGTTLTVTITDTVTGATGSQSYTIDIPGTVGGTSAYVGFTGGTGAVATTEEVASWTFSPQPNQPAYAAGISAGQLALNGSAAVNGTRLRLTDGAQTEAGSAFFQLPVNVQSFTTDFSFQLTAAQADGFAFVIQNAGATALGGPGGGLGYGPDTPGGAAGIPSSIAVKFDLFSNAGEGSNSTGLYSAGASPTVPATDLTSAGINLQSGDVFTVHATYDGTTLTTTVTDTATNATATQSYPVDIPATVGGPTAYVGFTAGTGGLSSTQDVLTWVYQGNNAPATAAASQSAPLTPSASAGLFGSTKSRLF